MDGYEVARRLQASPSRPRLMIAVTGHADPERRRKSSEAGFDEHLVKPAPIETLLARLAELVGAAAGATP
jgi:CheY-like chemotaxis protein